MRTKQGAIISVRLTDNRAWYAWDVVFPDDTRSERGMADTKRGALNAARNAVRAWEAR